MAAFLVGTGGLVMGFILFFGIIGIDGSIITDSIIYGTSGLIGANFDALTLLRVIGFTAIWTAIYGFFSNKVLQKRDVV